MRLYLDDDSIHNILIKLLRGFGHKVFTPQDFGTSGLRDAQHLLVAIKANLEFFSHNHDDFSELHKLILAAKGHHPGILVVRRDNDRSRDLTVRGIAVAVNKLHASGLNLSDEFQILNAWR